MRALLAFVPLAAGTTLTVRTTTCVSNHAQSAAGSDITGTFTTACGGEACEAREMPSTKVQGQTETDTFTVPSVDAYGPGCFKIKTTHHDGWMFCAITITATEGGSNGLGGSWSWTGEQWVDFPCEITADYAGAGCTDEFTNCAWTHTPTTASPTTAAPVVTCPPYRMDGRCGPKFGYAHCSGIPSYSVFCNIANGWCGTTADHQNAQSSDDFDLATLPAQCHPTPSPPDNGESTATTGGQTTGNGVSGDPFATDARGNKVQFYLPLQQEQHLITCGATQLYGRAMSSGIVGDTQQWFEMFRIVRAGEELLKVESKKHKVTGKAADSTIDITRTNSTAKTHAVEVKPLTTMNVAVMKQDMQKTGGVAYNGFEIAVSQNAAKSIGEGFSETAEFVTGDTQLQFSTAAATKFASATQQARYVHLDLRFVNLNSSTCSTGILAEIWGLKEMSAATTAMLQPSA